MAITRKSTHRAHLINKKGSCLHWTTGNIWVPLLIRKILYKQNNARCNAYPPCPPVQCWNVCKYVHTTTTPLTQHWNGGGGGGGRAFHFCRDLRTNTDKYPYLNRNFIMIKIHRFPVVSSIHAHYRYTNLFYDGFPGFPGFPGNFGDFSIPPFSIFNENTKRFRRKRRSKKTAGIAMARKTHGNI